MASESRGVGSEAGDGAAPVSRELARRLAELVFEWRPAFSARALRERSARWMSSSARSARVAPLAVEGAALDRGAMQELAHISD